MTLEDINITRKRLIFRAWHRGTREMDLILGSFADKHVPLFDEEALKEFEALLQNQDPDLYDWICGKGAMPEKELSHVMELLLKHDYVTAKASYKSGV